MSVLKRGPGRPPKVRPEASVPTEPKPNPVITVYPDPTPEPEAPKQESVKPSGRLVEVEIVRKYVPEGQNTEIKATVPPGTVMLVDEHEATRLLKLGAAHATENTFNR